MRIPQMPGVNHLRPDFQRHGHIGGTQRAGKAHRIVEQCFVRSSLNERRRKTAQVGEQRRDARVLAVRSGGHICAGEFAEIDLVNDRIDRVLGHQGCAGHGEVGPGRHQPCAGRMLALFAQCVNQNSGEIAAGTIAADGDLRRQIGLLAQEAPCRHGVFIRGRKRMFGREAVADRERADSRRASGLGHHAAMAENRARAITAAVEEHQHTRCIAAGRDRPFGLNAAEIGT